jgi:hypothetical protein
MGEENEMRTSSKVVGSLLILTTIALLMVPVAYTTPPTEGIGWFDMSIPDPNVEVRLAGKNMIVHQWGGGGNLFGIFEGVWIHDEWMVIHPTGIATVKGVWDTPYGVTFITPYGEYEGTLHVRYIGTVNTLTGEFYGQFVIISGTGDLESLHGQGNMWFDPANPPYAWSTMRYHFDPS